MLNLPQTTLSKIKKLLLRQKKQVDEEIKSLEKDDPVLAERVAETSEPGTDSFLADVHARLSAVRGGLVGMSKGISDSLVKIKKGSYGKCEKCGKQIEVARLLAMPTARLCISCSAK